MRPLPLYPLAFAAGLLFAAIGACGGKVIVDGTADSGGAGGVGGQGGALPPATGAGSTFSGPGCSFPSPVGSVANCSAVASGGAGMPVACSVATCDDDHNLFLSNCTEQSCICSYSGADGSEPFGCTCANNVACGDDTGSCCPFPF